MNPQTAAMLTAASSAIDAGDLAQAGGLCRQVLEAQPANGSARMLLARVRRLAGDFGAAAELAEAAARQMPRDPGPRLEAALAHAAGGDFARAEAAARKALRLRPAFVPGLMVLAEILTLAGKRDAAVAQTRRAAALAPDNYDVRLAHANALFDAQRFAEAVPEFEAAGRLRPELTEADYNRARSLVNLERLDEAATVLSSCIERAPGEADLYDSLAMIRGMQDRADDVFAVCDLGIARCAHPWSLWQGKADWSLILGREEECLACLERAREALRPSDAEGAVRLRQVRALTLLALGQFAEGWREMRLRSDRAELARRYPNFAIDPSSLPPDLAGRRLLVVQEQGLGDELFFLRYAPLLKARGARLAYQAESRMHAVLRSRHELFERILAPGDTAAVSDFSLLSGDLPEAAGGTIVPPLRLSPEPALLDAWRERLAALGPPPYLGVTWSAGLGRDEAFRSRRPSLAKAVPAELLAAAIRDVPGTVLILQRNPAPGSIERFCGALGRPAHDLSALNGRLDEMLALLALLNGYVCVSNANTHFAASLGLACRVLVMRYPEWRWMARGGTSPWFPGFRLYREQPDGDWSAPLGRLAKDLQGQESG